MLSWILAASELQQVQRGEIARRVVEEHVLGARVRRDDGAAGRAGVPVVDGRVVLQAGIGRVPGGMADLVPQLAGLQRLVRLAGDALRQRPVAVLFDRAQEVVGDADGIVGVLAGDGEIGVGIPVERVGVERDVGEALLGVLDDLLDRGVRHEGATGELDLLLQRGFFSGLKQSSPSPSQFTQALRIAFRCFCIALEPATRAGDLVLLLHLPVDVGLDVRMVDVDHHHLGGAARRAAGLDGAGRAVADLEEGHQAGRLAAAGQPLVLAAQLGEIGAGAGAVFEQARLAHPQVHDAALVDEVVGDRLDEAGVRLRMLVGRGGGGQLPGLDSRRNGAPGSGPSMP